MKRSSIYFTDEELKDLFYSETLASVELEGGDSEAYESAESKICKELIKRGLMEE